jgi:hypothetical protein
MARQIKGKDCVVLRQSFHVPAPAERSAEQSMQQQKRWPCSSAKIANSVFGNLCCMFLDLYGPWDQMLFHFGHSNRMLSALSLLIARFFQESSAISLASFGICLPNFSQKLEIQKATAKYQFQ